MPSFATTMTVAAVALRNLCPIFDSIDRDLWSAVCRIAFVAWAMCLAWRSLLQCDANSGPSSLLTTHYDGSECGATDIAYYGAAQVAFYVSEAVWIVRQPRRRSDDGLMLVHHAVSVGLISFWGLYHHLYWLSTVMPAMHDASDVFVDGAKYARRLARLRSTGARLRFFMLSLSDVFFALFVLTWFAIRVFYIPTQLLPNLLAAPDRDALPHALVAFGILCALQVAQAYWTLLIVRAGWRAVRQGGRVEDERERNPGRQHSP